MHISNKQVHSRECHLLTVVDIVAVLLADHPHVTTSAIVVTKQPGPYDLKEHVRFASPNNRMEQQSARTQPFSTITHTAVE